MRGRLGLLAGLVAVLAGGAGAQAADYAKACAAAQAYSTPRRGVAVLVLKDGKPVCEGYAGAGGPDKGFEIWSGTKSFTGVIAAAAVQDHLLSGLDEKVSDTITEWKADPQKAVITYRQLLGLVSGLKSQNIGQAPPYLEAVAAPVTFPPGTKFQYGPAPFQVFGEAMKRKLAAAGRPADPYLYLKARILDPLGVKPTEWRRTAAGDPLMPQGSVFTVREWVKFGEFVRAKGVVGGKPIVDQATLAQLFVNTPANPSYGVSWWLPHRSTAPDVVTASVDIGAHEDEVPQDMVIAAGAGDQRLYVIPSRHLTIAREASFDVAAIYAARAAGGERAQEAAVRGPVKWSDYEFLKIILSGF